MKKVLLYSGGMDSYIISKLWNPDVRVYIDYHTKQTEIERSRLPDDVIVVDLPLGRFMSNDGKNVIALRNLIFSAIAVNFGDTVALGGVADDVHFDSAEEFVADETALFNKFFEHEGLPKVTIIAPYKKYTKEQLLELYVDSGYSIDDLIAESWSCYAPTADNKECGECVACKRKQEAIRYIKRKGALLDGKV